MILLIKHRELGKTIEDQDQLITRLKENLNDLNS
jgi:hypothetical protein